MIQLITPHANNPTTMYEELVNPKDIPEVLCLHNMILIIRLKELRLAVHVSRMGEKRIVFSYLVGNPKI